MTQVLLASGLAAAAIAGEWLARRRWSRSTSWLVVHPLVLLAALLLIDVRRPDVPLAGAWHWAAAGVLVAAVGYAGLRWLARDVQRRPLPEGHPVAREGFALVLVLPVVEQVLWGWVLAPILGVLVVAALFAVKHPVSDGNWRRTPALAGFWLGMSVVRAVDPLVAIGAHMAANGAAFVKSVRAGRDEF